MSSALKTESDQLAHRNAEATEAKSEIQNLRSQLAELKMQLETAQSAAAAMHDSSDQASQALEEERRMLAGRVKELEAMVQQHQVSEGD